MTKGPENTALMLPGGGARGAYQVGVLTAIAEFSAEATGDKHHNPFPIISGTSAGARPFLEITDVVPAGRE